MNTLQRERTSQVIANEIRLERAAGERAVLLLEGSADAAFFRQFVDIRSCSLNVCGGRERVLAVVEILGDDGFVGFLAIIDRDLGEFGTDLPPGVVTTDKNDIECMIIESGAWDKLIAQYASDEKVKDVETRYEKPIKQVLISEAAFLGALRIVSKRRDLALKFDGMRIRYEPPNSVHLDRLEMVRHIIARSGRRIELTDGEITREAEALVNETEDKISVCCGHDVCRIVARAFRSFIGSYNGFEGDTGARELGRVLRLAYERSFLEETQLYRRVRQWERENAPFRVIPIGAS